MKKRPPMSPPTRRFIVVPERKLSESILEFAAPVLEPLGPVPELDEARRAIELAINIWNFHVMATPVWGKPKYLADARVAMCGPASPPELVTMFEVLSQRRRSPFDGDYRFVGKWTLAPDGPERHSLRCDAMLPHGCEPLVPPAAETRISLDGRYLDDVRVRQTATMQLAFPPERHRAEVKGDCVVLHVPALAAVEMFASGMLPPVRARAVELVVYAQPSRRVVLAEVRAGAQTVVGDVVSLTFTPATSES